MSGRCYIGVFVTQHKYKVTVVASGFVLSRAVVDNSREHVAATTRHRGTEVSIVAEIKRNHRRVKVI